MVVFVSDIVGIDLYMERFHSFFLTFIFPKASIFIFDSNILSQKPQHFYFHQSTIFKFLIQLRQKKGPRALKLQNPIFAFYNQFYVLVRNHIITVTPK